MELKTALDWSAYPGAGGGFQGAIEMCNNNGACRKLEGGVMCPSYRATRNEKDVTRGRANTLRLAISGQLGPDALGSDEMMDTLKLCVSCKACRHECPTGVDMAKMKIEVLAARAAKHGLSLRDRLVGYLPRYAALAARLAPLANLRNRSPLLRRLFEKFAGISAQRALPEWRRDVFRSDARRSARPMAAKSCCSPTPSIAPMSAKISTPRCACWSRADIASIFRSRSDRARPLCCGRTFLSAGLVDQARAELDRLVATYAPFAARGVPIIGLEPSCLLTLRDELLSLRSDDDCQERSARMRCCSRNFWCARPRLAGCSCRLARLPQRPWCTATATRNHSARSSRSKRCCGSFRISNVETIESSCCGMAGAFGYGAETYQASMEMAELSLLPAVRRADGATLIVADGTSCRHQIRDGAATRAPSTSPACWR